MTRRKAMIWFLAFFGLMAMAWISRPGSLVEQIERQGIHMTSKRNFGRSGPEVYYFVRHEDAPKLKAWLTNMGFKLDPTFGPNMNIYERQTRILGQFRPNSQRAVLSNDVEPDTGRHILALYLDEKYF